MKNKHTLKNFTTALINNNASEAEKIIVEAIIQKNNFVALDYFIVNAMNHIGLLGENGCLSLSEISVAGNICNNIIQNIIKPCHTEHSLSPRIGITTLGDYHLLGKQLVVSILNQSGFNIVDYGHGMGINSIIAKIIKDDLDILLISTLMNFSALMIGELRMKIDIVKPKMKILVGGTPFNDDTNLYKIVGADAMATSPFDASTILKKWTNTVGK